MLRRTFIFSFLFIFLLSTILLSQQQTPQSTEQKGNIGKPVEKVLIDFANLPDILSIEKWEIILSGYSDNPTSRSLSDLKIVNVDANKLDTEIKFNKCLGIHAFFEYSHGNDWAQIKPKIPISEFSTKEGNGIVKNVGPIKSISIWVSGRNYNNSIEVRLKDQNGKYKSINFGPLFFSGWRKLTWENPDYIKDIRKRDLMKEHLYPQYAPYLKFDSIVIYKSHQEIGGDFVTYVKDIRIEYEPMFTQTEFPINDEKEWKIKKRIANEKLKSLMKKLDYYYSDSTMDNLFEEEKKALKETQKQVSEQK